MDYQRGYQQGYGGTSRVDPAPGDPAYQGFVDGRNDRIAEEQSFDGSYAPAPAPAEPVSIGDYFYALIGLPIFCGLVAGVVALVVGGDYQQAALITAGITFALVVAYGVILVAARLLPLLIGVAIALYVLERIGVGPGLPPW